MAKRRPSRKRSSDTRTVKVNINVPKSVSPLLPPVLDAAPIRQRIHRSRTTNVPLRKPREPLVRRTIKVRYNTRQQPQPSYTAIDRYGRLRIYSGNRARRYLATEYHRPRREERGKPRGRRARNGQLDSLTADHYGLVGANLKGSMDQIADAALVSRALRRIR